MSVLPNNVCRLCCGFEFGILIKNFLLWVLIRIPSWSLLGVLKSLIVSIIWLKSDKCTNRHSEFIVCLRILYKIINFFVDFIQFIPFAVCNSISSFLQLFNGLVIVVSKLDILDSDLLSFLTNDSSFWLSLLLFVFLFLILVFVFVFFSIF